MTRQYRPGGHARNAAHSDARFHRYELPIIAITTDTDWVPSTERNTSFASNVEVGVSPRAFAFLALIGNWVLLPLYVAFLAARLVRRGA